MKTLQVGELKAKFSEVLKQVIAGTPIAVEYGRRRERVAVIVPVEQYTPKTSRSIGVLQGKARCVIHEDFELADERFLEA